MPPYDGPPFASPIIAILLIIGLAVFLVLTAMLVTSNRD